MSQEEKDWFSDREMFNMIQDVKHELSTTREELSATRESIRRYNGLWEKLADVEIRLVKLEQAKIEGIHMLKNFFAWCGWVVGIIGMLITLYNLIRK